MGGDILGGLPPLGVGKEVWAHCRITEEDEAVGAPKVGE
jgi:hypothetical protein